MIHRLAGIAVGALFCIVASAQSLDERVRDLELRVVQLERLLAQPNSSVSVTKPATSQQDGWQQRESWRSLKRGMTVSDVRSILGEPKTVTAFGTFTVWEYPSGGRAQFGRDDKLDGWGEPR